MGVLARAIRVVVVSVMLVVAIAVASAASLITSHGGRVGGAVPTRWGLPVLLRRREFAAYVAAPIKATGSATARRVRCYNCDGLAAKM